MKIKVIDEESSFLLTREVNEFLENVRGKVIDIKFSTFTSGGYNSNYHFCAMIMYEVK